MPHDCTYSAGTSLTHAWDILTPFPHCLAVSSQQETIAGETEIQVLHQQSEQNLLEQLVPLPVWNRSHASRCRSSKQIPDGDSLSVFPPARLSLILSPASEC